MDEDCQEEELHFLRERDSQRVDSRGESSHPNVILHEGDLRNVANNFLENSKATETSNRSPPVNLINNPRGLNVSYIAIRTFRLAIATF